jgi:hypothetical protein
VADEDSILTSTKKLLGITKEYDVFDMDISIHINSAFATLHQLGVGPSTPVEINGDTTEWSTFLEGHGELNGVRSYIYMKTRIAFDPPQNSATLESLKLSAQEYEFRLLVAADDIRRLAEQEGN